MNRLKLGYENFRRGLKKIQRADEKTKKAWFVGSSAVSMVLVIGLWLVYLNLTLPGMNVSNDNAGTDAAVKNTTPETGTDFFSVLLKGFEDLKGRTMEKFDETKSTVSEKIDALKGGLVKSNNFSLDNNADSYVPNDTGAVSSTPLH